MTDERKDLPPTTSPNFLEKVREALSVYLGNRGNGLDRGVTLRDLTDAGLVELRAGFASGNTRNPIGGAGSLITSNSGGGTTSAPGVYEPDFTKPPTPTGFTAIVSTSGNSIQVTTAPQTYDAGNGHAKTILYGAKYLSGDALPVFANSAVLTEFPGDVGSCVADAASLYRLWVKWVTTDGIESDPAGGTNGLEPTTGALDDAAITNLTATNIRSGAVTVGQYIMSYNFRPGVAGWRIDGNGVAELSNAVVRGTVFANAGQIGGITVASNAVRAGQTAYNTGQGFFLGSNGTFSLGNSTGSRLTWDGTNLNVVGGGTFSGALSAASGTFAGALIAATGSFSGSLSAATGTFSGNLSAAGGTFSGSLSAASGTFSGSLTASAVSAVNTINIAGNAVSVSNAGSGSGFGYTNIYVPPGVTAKVTAIATSQGGGGISTAYSYYHRLHLNGANYDSPMGQATVFSGGDTGTLVLGSSSLAQSITVTGPATIAAYSQTLQSGGQYPTPCTIVMLATFR